MKVESHERSTGMGAVRYTAILTNGEWLRVSCHKDAQYHGRTDGIENYSVEIPDGTVSAHFCRTNSGNEYVSIYDGSDPEPSFNSFEDADRWASSQSTQVPPMRRRNIMNEALATGVYAYKSLELGEGRLARIYPNLRVVISDVYGGDQREVMVDSEEWDTIMKRWRES